MEDSEVFPEGALGEKPGGGNISTYKELCGIANEMGQPDLIYKFMDLANHQASLNSKRGAAFGFARIAKQAGDALKPHLRELVPKLVRYQYDPNKRIQDAMGHIWRALVSEPKKTTDEFFDEIMEDLLTQAGSRLWRSREASCLALGDVIQGRKYSEVGKYLERIWTMAFRGIDDIKETVRLAGESLCRAVSSLTLRLCDTSLTPEADAKAAMAIVLPFLLSKGIMSSVSDIRRVSLNAVMKLVKGAGPAIRPQLSDLVYCMLESLSSLEDQRLNYAELHAERAGISTEKLENLRVAVAKDSPMWDTLDLCLRHVDVPTLEALVPRLIQLVRSGVGLNTRVGVAKFISQLAQRVGSDIRPQSGALLKSLFAAVKAEKSPAVRRAFAGSCGAVAKYAGEAQVGWLLREAAALYTAEGADKDSQLASALVLEQVSLQASEIFKGHSTLVLPLAFIARFDEEKDVSSKFQEIWEENTSGGAALLLYMSEIMVFLKEGLPSSSWPQKKKTAKATAYLAEKAGESLGTNVPQLLTDLLAELPGRLWEVLKAFKDKDLMKVVVPHLVGECSVKPPSKKVTDVTAEKEVVTFEPNFLSIVNSECFLHDMLISYSICRDFSHSLIRLMMTEPDEPKETAPPYEKMLSCLAAALEGASPESTLATGKEVTTALVATLGQGHLWPVKLSSLTTIRGFLGRLKIVLSMPNKDSEQNYLCVKLWLEDLLPLVMDSITEVKVLQVHSAALESLVDILEVGNSGPGLDKALLGTVERRLQDAQVVEKNAAAKALIVKGLGMLNNIALPMQE
ncbi:hypothetical protein R1sor_001367 [Riccia sorocarpa]|uniref:Proteasome adapter and scaffold protein ECM29 HEAT-repeat domain-containing protein n=1 Tax=Riccia sorocarpa TaxID=122646 RepID=A0ABD3GYW6_9MARC